MIYISLKLLILSLHISLRFMSISVCSVWYFSCRHKFCMSLIVWRGAYVTWSHEFKATAGEAMAVVVAGLLRFGVAAVSLVAMIVFPSVAVG